MTEKELGIFICECVNGLPDSGDNGADCMTLAKALIKRYPQITKKPVKLYHPIQTIIPENRNDLELCTDILFDSLETKKEWIDEHYCEVVS